MGLEFLQYVNAECLGQMDGDADADFRITALTELLLAKLEDAGDISPHNVAFYSDARGTQVAEVHAYAYDVDSETLHLFYIIDDGMSWDAPDGAAVVTTQATSLSRAFRRLALFVKRARTGQIRNVDDSDPVHELVELISSGGENGMEVDVELTVVTTGTATFRANGTAERNAYPQRVLDLVYLGRVCGTGEGGLVSVDFEADHGGALPCLVMPETHDGIRVILACIPGDVLADVYLEHRAALLERNVRCFLQLRGKVNKGIRDTALNQPEMLLPYNNGISATADNVDLRQGPDGSWFLVGASDFQIVNGGQTTATIALCKSRDSADVSRVRVAMKLSVVPAERIGDVVPLISKFANTQNKVQDADFSANHEWHIRLEQLSRQTWTTPSPTAPRGTRWFYERANGQYNDELGRHSTAAAKRKFKQENPAGQKITKTDAAKFLLGWEQHPSTVALGAQKAFAEFMETDVAGWPRRESTPSVDMWKRVVALKILHKRVERLYGEMGYQGYRSQVVTYSVARLSVAVGRRIDYERLWRTLEVPVAWLNLLKVIVPAVRRSITSPPESTRNISEWAKKEACWSRILELELDLPDGNAETVGEEAGDEAAQHGQQVEAGDLLRGAVHEVPAEVWFECATWAKQNDALLPWQRALSVSLGRYKVKDYMPSLKQAVQGRRLLLAAVGVGFSCDELTKTVVERLEAVADE